MRILKSSIDDSINFVNDIAPGQALEARYVRRHADYFACYISSQTACAQACRFCHLTFTGQNKPRNATVPEMLDQARTVVDYYIQEAPRANYIHYNFMARGEPLDSSIILDDGYFLMEQLTTIATKASLLPRVLISTIMPKSMQDIELEDIFCGFHPEIYYSLYTLDPDFRRKWLPRAIDPALALAKLAKWQRYTKKIVRIHHALIAGQNDSLDHAIDIVNAVRSAELRADFTLVRYNPASPKHGKESSSYEAYAQILREQIPGVRVKVIERVGFDVAASCGMFINNKE